MRSDFCISRHPVIYSPVPSRPKLTLFLLTLIAGIFRFYHLEHPCLWYDESMVFWRTCGSYGQLLDCLRSDGFVPLHYSLIWVIEHFGRFGHPIRPTPFMLRFVPALSGTLMVPAIYFFARQMLSIGTSQLAAAFAACSAFLLFYSRDAKMYMDAWFFTTLNLGCLLWWFRSGKSTAWLCWIASGCVACGLQISSAIPVAISTLLLLTQAKVRWQAVLLWALGVALILAGPAGYYEKFNTWKDRADQDWNESGLHWIGAYNYGRNGPELVRYLATSTLMGWEWPKDADVRLIKPERINWPARAACMLLGILILACLPWPMRWRRRGSPTPSSLQSSMFDLDSRTSESEHRTSNIEHSALNQNEPQWRVFLWLAFLIVIPLYGFYCRSMPEFAAPIDWWHWILERFPFLLMPMQHHWMLLVIEILIVTAVILIAIFNQVQPAVVSAFKLVLAIGVMLGICCVIAAVARSLSIAAAQAGKPWESLWVPRYLGFTWPALGVAVAAMIMRLPTWPLRAVAVFVLLGMNLTAASFRIFGQTEPPVDRMAADVMDARDPSHHTLIWMYLRNGMQSPGSGNLFSGPGQYYLDLLSNQPTTPAEFKTAIQAGRKENRYFPTPWHSDLAGNLNRVIIWRQFDEPARYTIPDAQAPAEWKLQSEAWFEARDCWIWQDLGRYRRTVWERSEKKSE